MTAIFRRAFRLNLLQYMELTKNGTKVCAYPPNRGINRDKICGELAITDFENILLNRCSQCNAKVGRIEALISESGYHYP